MSFIDLTTPEAYFYGFVVCVDPQLVPYFALIAKDMEAADLSWEYSPETLAMGVELRDKLAQLNHDFKRVFTEWLKDVSGDNTFNLDNYNDDTQCIDFIRDAVKGDEEVYETVKRTFMSCMAHFYCKHFEPSDMLFRSIDELCGL